MQHFLMKTFIRKLSESWPEEKEESVRLYIVHAWNANRFTAAEGRANGDPLRLFCCRLLALVHIVLCVTSEDRKKKMRLHYTSSSDI